MNKQREALELALAALCYDNSLSRGATIVAVREALAEPEQEPVARVKTVGGYPDASEHTVEWLVKFKDLMSGQLLYTARPASKPLTDEQISAIVQSMCTYTWDAHMLARAIERAHGIGE